MEARLDGARRHAQRLGCVVVRETKVVMKDENGPMLGTQPSESAIDLIPVGGAIGQDGGHDRLVVVGEPNTSGASLTARLSEHGPNQDAVDPGTEPIRVAQPAEIAPDDNKGLLDRVVGQVLVVQHQLGDVVEARDRRSGEDRERLAIPRLRALDKCSIHARPFVTACAAITGMGKGHA